MNLEVQPTEAMIDEPVSVRVTGISPGAEVALAAETVDARGRSWKSEMVCQSGDDGSIDPAALFWSMRSSGDVAFRAPWDKLEITLTARQIGPIRLIRRIAASGVTRLEVHEPGLTATFFEAPGSGKRPALALFHGSGGGIAGLEPVGALLASRGCSCLVVGYFDVPGLPKSVCEVPLEALAGGVKWLKSNPGVDPDRVGALGTSVGGEAVLAMASFVEGLGLKAVVAVSPSNVVWQALAEGPPPMKPRWTLRGRGLPFVVMRNDRLMGQMMTFLLRKTFRRPSLGVRTLPAYEAGLLDLPAVERASIPVERITCPVLLCAGKDDQVWPSPHMIEAAMSRRVVAGGFVNDELFACPDAGHMTIHVPNIPTTVRLGGGGFLAFGGTPQGDAAAAAEVWRRMLAFLQLNLG